MSHVPDFQMNQGFSNVLMPLAKCIGLFQTLNIASNEPSCASVEAESAFQACRSLQLIGKRLLLILYLVRSDL